MKIVVERRCDVVGEYNIFSRCAGNNPARLPVVLVHGLSVSSAYMRPLLLALAPHFRVCAPDLPGYGRSEKPPETLDLQALAGVLYHWMSTMGMPRAVLLGNSMGCQIILELARAHPQAVERAVLVGPTMDPSAPGALQLILRGARNMLYEPPALIPLLVRDYWAAGLRRTFRTLRMAQREPVRERLARMPAPSLVVRGQHDTIVTQPWAEEAARLLPDGRLVVIQGAAHATNYDASHALAGVVRRFVDA